MTENERTQEEQESHRDATAPPGGKTHEATTPPGKGDVDEEAVRKGEERIEQAGGGH